MMPGEVLVRLTEEVTLADGLTLCEGTIVSLDPVEAQLLIDVGKARRWGP